MDDSGDSSRKEEEQSKEGFFSRWSKRKQNSASDGEPVEDSTVTYQEKFDPIPPVGELDGALENSLVAENSIEGEEAVSVLTDEDMPKVSSLNEDSDYSGFMSPGVSEELRKLALRKLFSGVGFNVRDGLDDYDDDFRSFAALGDIVTSDMKHQMEMKEEREKEEREKEEREKEEREKEEREKEEREKEEREGKENEELQDKVDDPKEEEERVFHESDGDAIEKDENEQSEALKANPKANPKEIT